MPSDAVQVDGFRTRGLAPNGNLLGISAKRSDMVSYPFDTKGSASQRDAEDRKIKLLRKPLVQKS